MARVRDEVNPPSSQGNIHQAETVDTLMFSTSKKVFLSDDNHEQGSLIFSRIISSKFDGKSCRDWMSNPLNLVLLLWIACVGISGAILFLVMTGMLNHAFPSKVQKDIWFEVNNQILNALFTLMCLYQHPRRTHHLILLLRWRPRDASFLREVYCKNMSEKPKERAHIAVVIMLLHLNCFAQYALCSLNLVYDRLNRPMIGVVTCLLVSIAAPAIAAIYSVLSLLGKDYDVEIGEEPRNNFSNEHGMAESESQWRGGLLNLWDDLGIAFLSLFCGICLFGWNMERLGFGNKYVHIANFTLFLMAPFCIFNMAAMNLENGSAREFLVFSGFMLSFFGLCYGGYWRSRMREKLNLPAYRLCHEKPQILDCAKWLFCCWCALAQEVRTGDFYATIGDKVHVKHPGSRSMDVVLEPPYPQTIEICGSLHHKL